MCFFAATTILRDLLQQTCCALSLIGVEPANKFKISQWMIDDEQLIFCWWFQTLVFFCVLAALMLWFLVRENIMDLMFCSFLFKASYQVDLRA